MKPIPALGALAAAIALAVPGAASAAPITSLFGGAVNCSTSPSGPTAGQRFCLGAGGAISAVPSFDGTPIDVAVTLPPAPATGDDGNFPVVGVFHGYGSSKILPTDATNAQRWLAQGYAVFSLTDRGFWGSCGVTAGRSAAPGCSTGYIRLMSAKYEVRDAQYLLGLLADEGAINGQKIGAVGGSYGGGMSMILGALKNRVMQQDGSLVPWTSPNGKALRIAAAAPEYGWSDLVASLQPNGSTLDYAAQNPYSGPNGDRRFGVQKQNWNTQLYGGGAQTGWYAPAGTDPGADITNWKIFNDTGGPYDGSPVAAQQLAEFPSHGASTIDASVAPAPMIISNGWNDDLFPVDEAVRYYNRTRALHPTAPIVMYHANYGHPNRGGSPPTDDVRAVFTAETIWFNHYVKGDAVGYANPQGGVTVATSKCNAQTPVSGSTYIAESWAALSAGEIRVSGVPAQTIAATTTPASTYEGSAVTVCTDGPATDTAGAASYSTAPAPAGGYTIAGSPTVIADLAVTGANDQVVSRLYDVDVAAGTQKLIARGIYRPTGVGTSRQVFQLHPQAYAIAEGHRVKLELLPGDAPYARNATGQNPVGVSALDLRIPTIEASGAGGQINPPANPVLPAGYTLARDEKEETVVAQPTTPIVIPPIITAVPVDPTVQKPRDPLTVAQARAAMATNPTGVKVTSSRSSISFTDTIPENGRVVYRISIDAKSGKGKKNKRWLLGTVTKTVTTPGKVAVKVTVTKSRRALLKRNPKARLIVDTALYTAVEGNRIDALRKVKQ